MLPSTQAGTDTIKSYGSHVFVPFDITVGPKRIVNR